MLARLKKRINKELFARGVHHPSIRELLFACIIVTGLSLGIGLLLLPLGHWPFYFGVGATLATTNFWYLAKSAQHNVSRSFSPTIILLFLVGFTARLCLTGIALFLLIVRWGAPVAPLAAGLACSVTVITVWGLMQLARNPS